MAGTPEPISGARGVTDLTTSERDIEMWDVMCMLSKDKGAFSLFTSKLQTIKVQSPYVEWLSDEVRPPNDTLTASVASNGTTFAVTGDGSNESYATVNDTLYVPSTGETVLVTAVSARNLTVTRSVGDTTAASIASGATVVRLSTSWAEMSKLRDSNDAYIAYSHQSASNINYTQFHRTVVASGHRALATKQRGGQGHEHQQMLRGIEHVAEVERTNLFGDIAAPSSGISYAKGMWRYVPSANQNTIVTLTEDDLDDFIREATLDNGSGGERKVLFASRKVKSIISRLAAPNQRIQPGDGQEYGVEVDTYLAGSGEKIDIVGCRAFEESGEEDSALLVAPENCGLAVLDGWNAKLREGVQQNDQIGKADEFVSDVCVQAGNTALHHRITGITG